MMEPVTREEKFLASMTGKSVALPDPITRKEMFLAAATGMAVNVPEPITREEMYLSQIKPGDGSGVTIRNQNKTITENGTYTADSGYTGLGTVTVNVPIPKPVLEELNITENGEYTPGEGVDGFGRVTVEVPAAVPERTAWYRPPDFPDYSSLNLPDDEAYAFYTFDTEIPVAENDRVVEIYVYLYGRPPGTVRVERGHIAENEFVVDELVHDGKSYAETVTFTLPTDAGRFLVYRVGSSNPGTTVHAMNISINKKGVPCVETYLWNVGATAGNIGALANCTAHTMLYTARGCMIDAGTGEFWNKNPATPYAVVYDRCIPQDTFGYNTFTNLGKWCKALYITNCEMQLGSKAQNTFINASGLLVLDFTGSKITATTMPQCFSGCANLHRLDLSGWVMTGVTNMTNAFRGMAALVDLVLPEMPSVSFSLSDSTLLSVDSLVGVIAALPVLVEGTTATLTLGSTNTAKLTAEQIAVATEKGWTVA